MPIYNPSAGFEAKESFAVGDVPAEMHQPTSFTGNSLTYEKTDELVALRGGNVRLFYSMLAEGATEVRSRLYQNGAPTGTEHSDSSGGWIDYSEDLPTEAGDVWAVYAKRIGASGYQINNLRFNVA